MTPRKLRVTFRIDRNGDPATLTAVLPDLPANPGRDVCYAHVGQHSECSRDWYYSTRPATPKVYRSLLGELRQIYRPFKLKIVRRIGRR